MQPTIDTKYDRETRDWSAYVIWPDGKKEYVGSAPWQWEAEAKATEAAYQALVAMNNWKQVAA